MKKTARNDITGDWLQSKPNSEQFEKNWDLIFGKKKPIAAFIPEEKETVFTITIPELQNYIWDEAMGDLRPRNTEEQEALKEQILAEYELNKSTGEVQKVDNGDTTNT